MESPCCVFRAIRTHTIAMQDAGPLLDVSAEVQRLRAWEAELRQREEHLRRQEQELAEREERLAQPSPQQHQELVHLEQRIRNARRRLLSLAEEYERLRQKLQRLPRADASAPSNDYNDSSVGNSGVPADHASACPDQSPAQLAASSAGSSPTGHVSAGADQSPAQGDTLGRWPPLIARLHPDPVAWLAELAGDLFDRATELQELASALADLRSRWLQEWDEAMRDWSVRTAQLTQWQEELLSRQTELERAEADCAQRQETLRRRELELHAAETRCAARQRALDKAFSLIKVRWRATIQTLRQRELRLQWLLDEWQAQMEQQTAHWQKLHRQASQWIQQYASLARQCQQQLAQLELARYRLWQKQQALEMAIQTWVMQTTDPPGAEQWLGQCLQQLAQRLADWQRRLEQREQHLTEQWQLLQNHAAQLLRQQEQIESARRQFLEEKLADQWQAYCQHASLQRQRALMDIAEQERFSLREHNDQLQHAVESLAACLLETPASSAILSRAA